MQEQFECREFILCFEEESPVRDLGGALAYRTSENDTLRCIFSDEARARLEPRAWRSAYALMTESYDVCLNLFG